jgi:carboxyl-terminal processing protease
MKPTRTVLLIASTLLVLFLIGGAMGLKVGAEESSFRQTVLFAEILSLVLENYVDPVEADRLLKGAYEGMLGGLDPNGAYLTPREVAEWRGHEAGAPADPGLSVLKAGRSLQIVSVVPGSTAAEAGLEIGDQVRAIDERLARDLSLEQARRLLLGEPGSTVVLSVLHPRDGFRREDLELVRVVRTGRPYDLKVQRGIAVLRLDDLSRVDSEGLLQEMDDVRSRGVETLLIDLRNLAEGDPRDAAALAGLFADGTLWQLRDRSGRLIETVAGAADVSEAWPGSLAVLVNGATAGAGEALALLLKSARQAPVYGEDTYGLGAEARLYELGGGGALLVPAALWETAAGDTWNGEGIDPDHEISGEGEDGDEIAVDQLEQVLERLVAAAGEEGSAKAA